MAPWAEPVISLLTEGRGGSGTSAMVAYGSARRRRMPIATKIQYESVDNLRLDPKNPRLGRENTVRNLSQDQILRIMEDWTLDELAVSFIESGFWPQEALIVVKEPLQKVESLVVVEGNRRLAALMYLIKAKAGDPISSKWVDIAAGITPANLEKLKTELPCVQADTREEVASYIGYRHVTGIKEWNPAEKAEYIASLIDDKKLGYEEVRRRIGSKAPTVRQNYISYRLLLQMEELPDEISLKHVEEKFSVLYLSLRSEGTQRFLEIDIRADPAAARRPVPQGKLDNLKNFALWLFGNAKKEPLVADSRAVDRFGTILTSPAAVEYLRRNERPNFETAFRMAGGGEAETATLIERAADNIEEALGTVHHHLESRDGKKAVKRVGADAEALLEKFPSIQTELRKTVAG
jgi:hypothetical protein